jgi:hypothetical protein
MQAEVKRIINDFIKDVFRTFPELRETAAPSLVSIADDKDDADYDAMYEHIIAAVKGHAEAIMVDDATMFKEDCFILPGINFKTLWADNLTEATHQTIWKYLKLFLLFSNLDPSMHSKLEEMVRNMETMFTKDGENPFGDILNTKIGKLAQEIASETVDGKDMKGMMSNPAQIMSLVSNVGEKIDQRIKSGQVKESELIEEATELLQKMKDNPMMDQMFKQFAGGKVNMNAAFSKLDQNMKKAKQKERLQAKLKKRKEKK